MAKNPMPTVTFRGCTYSLLKRSTQVPNLSDMTDIEASLWLVRNTKAKGYQTVSQQRLPNVGVIN